MFKVGGVFIPVTDLSNSKQWYEKNLGVKKVDEWSNEEDQGVGYFFQNGTTGLALIKVEQPQPTEFTIKGQRKNVYFNFVVEDIEKAKSDLAGNGVKTTDIVDYGDMKGFDFYDPDGNTFSVVMEENHSPYHHKNILQLQENN